MDVQKHYRTGSSGKAVNKLSIELKDLIKNRASSKSELRSLRISKDFIERNQLLEEKDYFRTQKSKDLSILNHRIDTIEASLSRAQRRNEDSSMDEILEKIKIQSALIDENAQN
ncbi:uncharacterized protein LOC113353851 [Papaver somniferum]|uniref:uncharacterized protein LOC113353851 n=1 Tax=Papaver somniferum TaxID=3469 RepID=UPI000E6F71D2|nr:uncharacterized protein LOC113353851 [Papaver somniferum]